jgi:hypothetical protein
MNELIVKENKTEHSQILSFCWKDSSSIKQLLDVIANIIAQEYINVVQGDPTLFTIKGKTL